MLGFHPGDNTAHVGLYH